LLTIHHLMVASSLENSMNIMIRSALALAVITVTAQAQANIVLYENESFGGRSFNTENRIDDFQRYGFNDRASSVVVLRDRWEVCEDASYNGQCIILRPGRYASLSAMGMNNRISSARIVSRNKRYDDDRYAPEPVAVYDNSRRKNEKLYDANVTSVRVVQGATGPSEQRCWVEREQVPQTRGDANLPGAIIGGLLGGVLGHQVGGGRGKDIATVAGVVAGGAVGANVGRDKNGNATQDVQRCKTVSGEAKTEYYDVSYTFRNKDHRVQMVSPPGATVRVNWQGEPRS
jgi:uncharacterized protein YcfJ